MSSRALTLAYFQEEWARFLIHICPPLTPQEYPFLEFEPIRDDGAFHYSFSSSGILEAGTMAYIHHITHLLGHGDQAGAATGAGTSSCLPCLMQDRLHPAEHGFRSTRFHSSPNLRGNSPDTQAHIIVPVSAN